MAPLCPIPCKYEFGIQFGFVMKSATGCCRMVLPNVGVMALAKCWACSYSKFLSFTGLVL